MCIRDSDKTVEVRAGDKTSTFVPAKSGLDIDYQATVDAAGIETANPTSRLRGLFTTHEVDAVPLIDDTALNRTLDRISDELHFDPTDGTIRVEAGKAETTKPVNGQKVERDLLREETTTGWLNPDGIDVDPTSVPPAIDDAVMSAAMDGPVRAALDGPLTVTGRDDHKAAIPQERPVSYTHLTLPTICSV